MNYLIDWYERYGTLYNFLIHKATHFLCGLIIALIGWYFNILFLSAIVVAGLAIGKEIVDEFKYPMPLYCHIFDVLITVLGIVPICLI